MPKKQQITKTLKLQIKSNSKYLQKHNSIAGVLNILSQYTAVDLCGGFRFWFALSKN